YFFGALRSKERVDGRNSSCHRELVRIRRFDAAHPMPASTEVAQEGAVVRADVDHQVPGSKRKPLHQLVIELREVLAKDTSSAARICVMRRENNVRIDDQPKLHQCASPAV